MRYYLPIISVGLLLVAVVISSAEADSPTGLAYLKVGVGGRAAGMGEATAAVVDDPTSAYWNPAGLVATGQSAAVFSYHHWIQDVAGQFAAGNFRWKRSAVAVHYLGMNVDDIELRTGPSANPIGTFGAHDVALGISYATDFGAGVRVGGTLKYLWESIFEETSHGWAVDLGAQKRNLFPGLSLGAVLKDVGQMTALRVEAPTLPSRIRVGAAYDWMQNWVPELMLAADVEKPFEGDGTGHIGIEVRPVKPLALRAGYITGIDSRGVTAGFGLDWARFHVNYGYSPFQEDLGDGHRFSVGLDF